MDMMVYAMTRYKKTKNSDSNIQWQAVAALRQGTAGDVHHG